MEWTRTTGHEKQKELFSRAVRNNRLAHAFVFVGPENIGKTTFALDLAAVLGADPVMDVTLLDAENGLSVEDARTLQSRLSLSAAGKMKVAIIAGAERMSLSVANLFLKTLEEPPRQSLIILTTANYYALLPTIASRVQRVNFSVLSDEEVIKALTEFDVPAEKLPAIVEFSAGRLGLAKRIATSAELFEFFVLARQQTTALNSGTLLDRLRASETAAKFEENDLRIFLTFSMRFWVREGGNLRLAAKLRQAWADSRYNLNQKLMLDNLFLP